jgi:hypothetical protein
MNYDRVDLYDLKVGDRFVEAGNFKTVYTVTGIFPGGDGVDVVETRDPKGRSEQWWYSHPQGRPSIFRIDHVS